MQMCKTRAVNKLKSSKGTMAKFNGDYNFEQSSSGILFMFLL